MKPMHVRLKLVARIGVCMLLSLGIGTLCNWFLKKELTADKYELAIQLNSSNKSTLQFYCDFGNGFSEQNMAATPIKKGKNEITLPINEKDGAQLRRIRLDFGWNEKLNTVKIDRFALKNTKDFLFDLRGEEIQRNLVHSHQVTMGLDNNLDLQTESPEHSFDPHVIFRPLNELIFPQWQRILMLIVPWLLLFFLPALKWLRSKIKTRHFGLLLVALFLVSVPLKIAWVTFTTLLLLAYALARSFSHKSFRFDKNHLVLLLFFSVPLLFLSQGDVSKLMIPLGFVLFAIIGTLTNFSKNPIEIKKIYITVFLIVMSIALTSWLLLMGFDGYYYGIDFIDYFVQIKLHAHTTLYWLFYKHSTFLSFFVVVGGVFILDLFEDKAISKHLGWTYGLMAFAFILVLGSRFALLIAVLTPFLYKVPARKMGKWMLPAWGLIFGGVFYLVQLFDAQRAQLWDHALTAIRQKPWLGHGTGTSSSVLPDHVMVDQAGATGMLEINHAHNQILTYLLENGILGTILFLGAYGLLVYFFMKNEDKSMLVVSFLVLLLCIIESPFRTATPLYMIAFLFALLPVRKHGFKGFPQS